MWAGVQPLRPLGENLLRGLLLTGVMHAVSGKASASTGPEEDECKVRFMAVIPDVWTDVLRRAFFQCLG